MRHQHQRRAALGAEVEEKLYDRPAIRFIEIAGGFVGDQDRRPRGKRW